MGLEHNAELLQGILNRVMQRIVNIFTPHCWVLCDILTQYYQLS